VQRFFANLGPGLVTGAVDDDPSGITTFSAAGAVFGYSFLWTALVSLPLMAAVQLMYARLGMVTKHGKTTVAQRRGSTNQELSAAKDDVLTGMFVSNLVMFFIILTTADTLHAHGMRNIETAKQASEALRPLAARVHIGYSRSD